MSFHVWKTFKFEDVQTSLLIRPQARPTKHYETVHIGIKYECVQCQFQTTNTQDIPWNQNSVHMGVWYPYKQCGYQATQKEMWIVIFSKCMGRKYQCQECAMFTDKSKINIRSHHIYMVEYDQTAYPMNIVFFWSLMAVPLNLWMLSMQ
jgi:hypothetical protein